MKFILKIPFQSSITTEFATTTTTTKTKILKLNFDAFKQ